MPRPAAITRAVPAATGRQAVPASVNVAVPAKKQPVKKLLGWEIVFNNGINLGRIQGAQAIQINPHQETLSMAAATYQWLKNTTPAIQALADQKAEAVRQMKVTMWDSSRYAAPTAAPDRKPPAVPLEAATKALLHDATLLVQDLARLDTSNPTAVSDAAGRYGRLRDTMASLRAAFTEVEGCFELAQSLIVEKMEM